MLGQGMVVTRAVTRGTLVRLERLMAEAIERLGLNLQGLIVYTEAAAGPFAVTAPLAARAGAERVIALARPWQGLSASEIGQETQELANFLSVGSRITVVTERSLADLATADIVTNLGFVRPIDREVVMVLKPTAAISYMREAWEVREEDVDLSACRERGIAVFATDEHHPDVCVFDSCGLLAVKLLFEAGVEVSGSVVVVVSGDPFGPIIADFLKKLGAQVHLVSTADAANYLELLPQADALIMADFRIPGWLIGFGGVIEPSVLAKWTPGLVVVAFAGGVDGAMLGRLGVRCVPGEGSRAGHMGRTLADLGPRPIINLHAAGLKVGAAAVHGIRLGLTGQALAEHVCRMSPAEELPETR